MSSPDAAIVVTALRKTYGTVEAVKGISFTVCEGTTTALPGGNGAGKTTTLSMLLGGLTPTAGQITVLGEDMPRNFGNLFVSPLTLPEFIAGQLVMSVLRTLIGVGGACAFARRCSRSRCATRAGTARRCRWGNERTFDADSQERLWRARGRGGSRGAQAPAPDGSRHARTVPTHGTTPGHLAW